MKNIERLPCRFCEKIKPINEECTCARYQREVRRWEQERGDKTRQPINTVRVSCGSG